MRMPEERYERIKAALLRDPTNVQRIADEIGATWRSVKAVWEGGVPGKLAVREIVAERDAIRRSVLAEDEEKRRTEVARVRDEILVEKEQALARVGEAMKTLDERTAAMEAKHAELVALQRDLDARMKRLRETRIEHGAAEGRTVRDQESLMANGMRQTIGACVETLALAFTPEAVLNLGYAIRRGVLKKDIDPAVALATLRTAVSMQKPLAEAGKLTAEIERMASGDPTSISRTDIHVEVTGDEDFETRVATLNRRLRRGQLDSSADAELEPAPAEPLSLPPAVESQPTASDQPICDAAPPVSQTSDVAPQQDATTYAQVPEIIGSSKQGGGAAGG